MAHNNQLLLRPLLVTLNASLTTLTGMCGLWMKCYNISTFFFVQKCVLSLFNKKN